jgi:hypothetical protein
LEGEDNIMAKWAQEDGNIVQPAKQINKKYMYSGWSQTDYQSRHCAIDQKDEGT